MQKAIKTIRKIQVDKMEFQKLLFGILSDLFNKEAKARFDFYYEGDDATELDIRIQGDVGPHGVGFDDNFTAEENFKMMGSSIEARLINEFKKENIKVVVDLIGCKMDEDKYYCAYDISLKPI